MFTRYAQSDRIYCTFNLMVCNMEVVNFKKLRPASRSDIINALRQALELAHKEQIEYLDIVYYTKGKELGSVHVDGVYSMTRFD